jgi:hypothetical protein
MTDRRHFRCSDRITVARVSTLSLLALLAFAATAHGQTVGDTSSDQVRRVRERSATEPRLMLNPELVLTALPARVDALSAAAASPAQSAEPSTAQREPRSKARAIAGGAVGAVAGFFGGGFLGAAIEGDRCNCDDPGLMGFIIGAPIGTAAGAILGTLFLF